MQRLHHLLLARVRGQQPQLRQQLPPGRLSRGVDRSLLLHGPGEQVQPIPDRDVLPGQVARGRRQVVRGHTGQAELPPPVRAARLTRVVLLEPQDRGAQDAALPQVLARPRLDRAEILSYHDRSGPMRLQRQDAHQGLVVVPDVSPGRRGRPGRDPPQPEQPDHMVDPDPPGVAQHRAQHVPVGRVAGLGQPVRAAGSSPGPAG